MARGQARRLVQRVTGHSVLIGLSCVFLLPFAWLVATSLKADDDLMEVPRDLKVFVPKGRFAVIDGELQRVSVGQHEINYPAKIIEWAEGPQKGKRALVAVSEIVDGRVKRWVDAGGEGRFAMLAAGVVKDVPASREQVWKRVEQYMEDRSEGCEPVWDCVPATEIDVRLWPRLANYSEGLARNNFGRFYLTTVLITVSSVFLMVLSCSFTAYGFGILEWRGRNVVFFIMFTRLEWINTFRPLVVPALFGSAFFIFLLRQFYLTIPRSLLDAARIDGCSELRIWWELVMPLSKPALMTVGLFAFLGAWNDFLGPLVYITSEIKYTLSLGLAMFLGQYGTEYGMLMAMTVLTVLPILALFFFAQRTFIQGVKLSGTKG